MLRIFAALGLGAVLSNLCAQELPKKPSFEVASVKKNTTAEKPSVDVKGDQLLMYNMPLRVIVALAYQVNNDRVSGASWMDLDGYDIVAKLPADTTRDSLWVMVQNLLTERFRLEIHHEQTPTAVYAFALEKDRPSLREAAADSPHRWKCDPRERPKLTCQFQKTTIAQLAEALPHLLPMNWFDAPVVDQSGLTAVYDFSLTFTMTDRPPDASTNAPDTAVAGAPYLLDAIREQLGLKVERRKAPIDRIVIDHAERVPSSN